MISGQLGNAQLGFAQLGNDQQIMTPGGIPPTPSEVVSIIDVNTLNIIIIPNYFVMMGRQPPVGEL